MAINLQFTVTFTRLRKKGGYESEDGRFLIAQKADRWHLIEYAALGVILPLPDTIHSMPHVPKATKLRTPRHHGSKSHAPRRRVNPRRLFVVSMFDNLEVGVLYPT